MQRRRRVPTPPPVASSAARATTAAAAPSSPWRTVHAVAPAASPFALPAAVRRSAATWRWPQAARWTGAGYVAVTEPLDPQRVEAVAVVVGGTGGTVSDSRAVPPRVAVGPGWSAMSAGMEAAVRRWRQGSVRRGTSRRFSWMPATPTPAHPGTVFS